MLTASQNPPQRPDAYASVADIPGPWWIAHTKARNEKSLAWDLGSKGVDFYLPMMLKETYSGDRRRKNFYPLFTSYVFFAGDKQTRYDVLTTNRVANVLEVTDRETFIEELTSIERVVEAGDILDLIPGLPVGERVRVTGGPFQGTLGTVTTNRPWHAILLTISALGVGAELKIHGDLLELVS